MRDLLLCVHVVVKRLNFGNFTWSFGRLLQRIVLKCVQHVQHDYFSSFNQSKHCFLVLSLPFPPSLLKLPDMKISRHLADYVKTLHQKGCRTCSTINFPHSTNEIIDLWRCRCRCCVVKPPTPCYPSNLALIVTLLIPVLMSIQLADSAFTLLSISFT